MPQLIARIAELVAELPPVELLERAWHEEFRALADVKDDTDIGHDEMTTNKMVTYVQSVIASVPRASFQKSKVSEEDWQNLKELVSKLFGFHMRSFTMSLEERQINAQSHDHEARVAARIESSLIDLWYTTWGKRFPAHLTQYLEDLLLPQSAILEDTFGTTATELIRGLVKIDVALRFGHAITIRDIEELGLIPGFDSLEELPQTDHLPASSAPDWVNRAARHLGWPTEREDVHARVFEQGLFDVARNSQLPEKLLRELSWEPGADDEFFSNGHLAGSPLRTWPITKRPFLLIDGNCYCFDPSALSDFLYRNLYQIVCRLRPDLAEAWRETQAKQMELLAAKYFGRLLPGAMIFSNAHYKGYGLTGEVDALVIYDDHLIIVETKGGAYASNSPAVDFAAHIDSVKELGSRATNQAARFKRFLKAAPTVPIFDSNNKRTRNKLADINLSSFRRVSVCAITLDPFPELAARLHHLTGFGIKLDEPGVWLMSLDDLHVYADVFHNPLVFLHYVEQRTRAARSPILDLDDELDHLGMYMAHNQYSEHVEDQHKERPFELAMFTGYRAQIEQLFADYLTNPASTRVLQQDTPKRLREVLQALARSPRQGRARVASYLLDRSGETRDSISDYIEKAVLEGPISDSPRTFATYGEGSQIVVACLISGFPYRSEMEARTYAQTLVVMNNEVERLVLELTYSPSGVLRQVDWQWVRREDIPEDKTPVFRRVADDLRRARKGAVIEGRRSQPRESKKGNRRKIGRNEPCFCGSGKKFKRCCIDIAPADPGAVTYVDYRE